MAHAPKFLFGFHAVGVRLKTAPQSIEEIYFEATRRDARMRQFLERAKEAAEAQEQAALAAAEALFEPVPGEAASEAEAAGDATA